MATPLSTGSQKSASAPPMIAKGAQPVKPPKNLPSIMVSMFVATATGIWKMAKMVKPTSSGRIRPNVSEAGLIYISESMKRGVKMLLPPNQRTEGKALAKLVHLSKIQIQRGGKASQHTSTNRLVPSVITSLLVPNSFAVTIVAVLKTLLAKVIVRVKEDKIIVAAHFFLFDQFIGFSGSSGPSQSTMFDSGGGCSLRGGPSSLLDAASFSTSGSKASSGEEEKCGL